MLPRLSCLILCLLSHLLSEDAPSSSKSKGGTTQEKKAQPLSQTARVETLALDSNSREPGDVNLDEKDQAVLEKIRKALARAQHENANEGEAKNAMRQAQTLMSRINVSQADLMEKESVEERQKRAGMSTVIIRTASGKVPQVKTWVNNLMSAMKEYFDCKT